MLTNFTNLTTESKIVWSRDLWKAARNMSFIMKFAGEGSNSMVQRITTLTKDERGDRAVITLVADLESDGTAGDNTLEGREEEIKVYDRVITIDMLRHANRNKGRMTDQRSIVNFRESSKDVLSYWLADRIDQMAFLMMSGISFTKKLNGAARDSATLNELAFASDSIAPSTNRHRQWNAASGKLVVSNTGALAVTDTPSYSMLVELKAYAKTQYIRGLRGAGGAELFHVFMSPQGMAKLKLDADYLANVRNAGVRGGKNELFAGTDSVLVDGMMIHDYRHVFNTTGLTGGNKWGGGNVDGQRILFCGAQALALADIGNPLWDEKEFDYGNQQGISTGKMLGMLKPKFVSTVTDTNEDFGIICVDTAI